MIWTSDSISDDPTSTLLGVCLVGTGETILRSEEEEDCGGGGGGGWWRPPPPLKTVADDIRFPYIWNNTINRQISITIKFPFFSSTRFTVDGKSHGSDFPLPLRVSKSELEKSPNFRIPIWEKFARGARRKEKENVITFYCCGREVLPDVWCVAST